MAGEALFDFADATAEVRIVVPGQPVAKGRPKFAVVAGHARAFTPAKTRRYEDLVRLEAGHAMEGREQLEGALSVKIRAYMQMPLALAKSKNKSGMAEAGIIRPTTRPDCDNIAKCVDALNGIVWRDDAQIVELVIEKFYSSRPRLELTAVAL